MKSFRILYFLSLILIGIFAKAWAQPTGPKAFAALLSQIVQKDGVRWDLMGPSQKELLQSYLSWAEKADVLKQGNSKEQLAFWINAHNACVMKIILSHLPLENVMTIQGFRDQQRCKIAGISRSLVDIESGVLRPQYKEPRIHFALWWGVRGGPRLRSQPYKGKTLDQDLEEQTKQSVGSDYFFRIQQKPYKQVQISSLFDWYQEDFGPQGQEVLRFIRKRLPKTQAKELPKKFSQVAFMPYDWTLDQGVVK